MRRSSLAACVACLFPLLGIAQPIRVGKTVTISADAAAEPHGESFLAINPRNGRNMLAATCKITGDGKMGTSAYVTRGWREDRGSASSCPPGRRKSLRAGTRSRTSTGTATPTTAPTTATGSTSPARPTRARPGARRRFWPVPRASTASTWASTAPAASPGASTPERASKRWGSTESRARPWPSPSRRTARRRSTSPGSSPALPTSGCSPSSTWWSRPTEP